MHEQDKTLARLDALAESLGMVIPDACRPGVLANTQLLQNYIDLICGMPLPDTCPPAYEYQP